uniref:Uncharacterized protein n=1 Tax=Ananas comosus var. bracteatus TaxID=296719 RepID=A0A6V7NNI9_ANACO|nr:unnamed protein product [Ananas comosus var. bracteatus]
MTSIRSMCLSNHPGFDLGGTLWFQNLTDFPRGVLGSTFPILIASLHYINVQISFQTVQLANLRGMLGLLAKYYKLYLDILAIPLLLVGFYIPQGSLVYWTTNSLFTLFQQLSLKNTYVRAELGLPALKVLEKKTIAPENIPPESCSSIDIEVSVESLPPEKLLELALQELAAGNQDRALPLLRIATEKDPDLVRALIAMGQTLCSKGSFVESAEYFERAIPKIEEEDALLVLACFGAGVSHILQGNKQEGIKHLKRIAELREPDEPMDKACYHKGLVMLGSTLFQEGEKAEAVKYLRIAATYDPAVNAYVKECEDAMEVTNQIRRLVGILVRTNEGDSRDIRHDDSGLGTDDHAYLPLCSFAYACEGRFPQTGTPEIANATQARPCWIGRRNRMPWGRLIPRSHPLRERLGIAAS